MIELDVATVLLQWATGGLLFLWFTTRKHEISAGYGWLLRGTFCVLAAGAAAAGIATDFVPVRDVAAIAVAVVGAFTAIPEAALVMAVLGLVGGYMADEADKSNRTYFLVFAVALGTVSGAAAALPVIGGPISDIMANLSTIVNAAALAVILNAIKDRASE